MSHSNSKISNNFSNIGSSSDISFNDNYKISCSNLGKYFDKHFSKEAQERKEKTGLLVTINNAIDQIYIDAFYSAREQIENFDGKSWENKLIQNGRTKEEAKISINYIKDLVERLFIKL